MRLSARAGLAFHVLCDSELAVSRFQPAVHGCAPALTFAAIRSRSAWECSMPGCRIPLAARVPASACAALAELLACADADAAELALAPALAEPLALAGP